MEWTNPKNMLLEAIGVGGFDRCLAILREDLASARRAYYCSPGNPKVRRRLRRSGDPKCPGFISAHASRLQLRLPEAARTHHRLSSSAPSIAPPCKRSRKIFLCLRLSSLPMHHHNACLSSCAVRGHPSARCSLQAGCQLDSCLALRRCRAKHSIRDAVRAFGSCRFMIIVAERECARTCTAWAVDSWHAGWVPGVPCSIPLNPACIRT